MSQIERLLERFIDDADGLSEAELAELAAALKANPALVEGLRDQLLIDELLRQKLSLDRADFLAQVRQRVSDHERGECELDARTAELSLLAMRELEAAPEGRRRRPALVLWASLASLLLAVAAAALAGYLGSRGPVARIAQADSSAVVVRGESRLPAGEGFELKPGDVVESQGGEVAIGYDDGTTVQLSGDSTLAFEEAAGKQLLLSSGELVADIAAQPAGRPMIFRTPAAEALVVGTRLRLRASLAETELEVLEGAVELRRRDGDQSQMVNARQLAVLTTGHLTFHSTEWPLDRRGLVILAPAGVGEGLVRSSKTGRLAPFRLKPRGEASLEGARAMRLAGGAVVAERAGRDLLSLLEPANGFSLEVIFRADGPAGTLLTYSPEASPANFELVHDGDWLVWRSRAPTGAIEYRLAQVAARETSHLVVTAGSDGFRAFLNGRLVFEDGANPLADLPWAAGALLFGNAPGNDRPFRGEILGAAIYDRSLPHEDALLSSRRLPVKP
jgi:ferric-dicitrate binding protein FerR (iron transport regulator)